MFWFFFALVFYFIFFQGGEASHHDEKGEISMSGSDGREMTAFSEAVIPLDGFKCVRNRSAAMDPAKTNMYNFVTGSTETRTDPILQISSKGH